jgi:ATP-dependent DNA ligase
MIKPMLAYKVGKKDIDWSGKVFLQPKLDGVRCVFTKDGAFSRTGKQFKNVHHLSEDLSDFFKQYPHAILDGELYNHNLKDDFEKIISLVRKQKPTDQDMLEASNLVQYHVYDLIPTEEYVTIDMSYDTRYNWLINKLPIARTLSVIFNTKIDNLAEAKVLHDIHLAQGYEGSILRTNGAYQQKRSYNLQKFKDFHDTEATIVGYVPGKGKFTGLIGKFLMRDDDGIEFGCPIGKGYNFDDRRDILNNIHDYIGKRATFTYFERTKANSYRHPLYKTLRNYE